MDKRKSKKPYQIILIIVAIVLGLNIHKFREHGFSFMDIYDRWNGLIPLLGGVYAFLLANGTLPRNQQRNEKMADWRKKYGKLLIVISPVLVVLGGIELYQDNINYITSADKPAEIEWHTAECPELGFKVELPGVYGKYTVPLENGGKLFGFTSKLENGFEFNVVCADIPAQKMTENEYFDDIKRKDTFTIEKDYKVQGHRALEGSYKSGSYGMFRLYYVDQISYMIMAEGKKKPDSRLKAHQGRSYRHGIR